MAVKGNKRRDFNNRWTVDMPDGSTMRISITDDGQIKFGINNLYKLESMHRGGPTIKEGNTVLILIPGR